MRCPSCGTENEADSQVLRRVWEPARARLRRVRHRQHARSQVLRRVRDVSRRRADPRPGRDPRGTGGRTTSGLRPVRRPRRLHLGLGDTGRGGHARAALAVLRRLPAADRAVRRHGREVHRRRGDGGVGDADRDRGRRRARRPRGAGSGRGGDGARGRGRRGGPPCSGGRAHGRGGGHDRRRGPGHGRRRPGQHGVADPGAGRAGGGARRGGDPSLHRPDDRLRRRGIARAEGEGRPRARLARPARRLRCPRRAQVDRVGGAVRGARRGAPSDQGPLPHLRRRAQAAADLGRRDRRDRQVAAGMGVLQVLRRDRADHVLAPRPLPLVRRRGHLLGARGHGPDARADRRGRGPGLGARQAGRGRRGAPAGRGGAAFRRAAAAPPARAGGEHPVRARGPVRRLAPLLRAARRRLPDGDGLRGHAVGGCLAARLHRVPARMVQELAPVRDDARAPRAPGTAADLGGGDPQLHLDLPGAAAGGGDGGAARRPRPRPARDAAPPDPRAGGGDPAVRGRDGPHAARPRRTRPGGSPRTGRPGRSSRSRCRRPCTR